MMTTRGAEASGRGGALLSVLLTSPGTSSAVGRGEPLYRSRPSGLPVGWRPAGRRIATAGGGGGRPPPPPGISPPPPPPPAARGGGRRRPPPRAPPPIDEHTRLAGTSR